MSETSRRKTDAALLLLRLFLGVRLIYGVQDNIFSLAHMREFEAFLQQFHFPFPMISAIVSAYAQAIAGLLFIAGWKTRWAALLMVINFVIALIMVHRGQSFEQMTTVLFMIVVSLSLLLTGAGRYSLDRE